MHDDPLDNGSMVEEIDFTRGNGRKDLEDTPPYPFLIDGYGIGNNNNNNNNVEMKFEKKERKKGNRRRGFEHAEENNRCTGGGVLSTTR